MRAGTAILGALVLTVPSGCVTSVEDAPAGLEESTLVEAKPARAWQVMEEGRAIGSVLCYEGERGEELFAVRNEHGQDLGFVDALGRAWRNRPHRQPQWLGSGSVAEGVARILGLVPPAELVEIPLDALR